MSAPAPEPAPVVYYRVTIYESSHGFRLLERTPLGPVPEGFVRFVGNGMLNFATPQGPMQHAFQFPIEADTPQRAFEQFEAQAQLAGREEAEKLRAHFQQQRMAPAPLLGPDGKPF